MRRVVVTGIGVATPFGCEVDGLWTALRTGQSAGRTRPAGDDSTDTAIGAPVTGFDARHHIDAKALRLMTLPVSLGVAAAQMAAVDSGLAFGGLDPVRLGCFVGSRGQSSERQDLLAAVQRATEGGNFRLDLFGQEGVPLVHPMWLLKGLANNVLYFVSLKFNAQGMNNNISMGGAAGTMAIGEAFHAVRRGYLDVAFAGGYDSTLDRLDLYAASGLVSASTDAARASRPFDRQRDGFLPGEGAAFLILEERVSALDRGARIYGEVLGYGSAGPASAVEQLGPSEAGFRRALSVALADAGGGPPDAVFMHGLATQASDLAETRALKTLFGSNAMSIPAPAITSMTGYAFAAAGAIGAAAALLAMQHGEVPPTINLSHRDEACDLDYVAGNAARPKRLRTVALNDANLAGAHAALVLGHRE